MQFNVKQVAFIEANNGVSRAGEGAFLRLSDGGIMYAYTEYYTEARNDDATARIACICSRDNGESWGEYRVLLEKEEDALNIMSVSFMRLPNGDALIFYLKKSKKDEKVLCRPFMRRSSDDGASWSDEICCFERDMYYVVNNDRVLRLSNGRLIMPSAVYEPPVYGQPLRSNAEICFIISDDDGATWYENKNRYRLPDEYNSGPEEPGIYEHEDGSLWCYFRTWLGCQWELNSTDGGESFSGIRPNFFFSSPNSPMLVKKVLGYTVAVFNPIPNYNGRNSPLWGRTPFLMCVSETDGVGHGSSAFTENVMIESDLNNSYCYPAIIEGEDYMLLAYYHSNGSDCPLNSSKIVKISIEK